MPRSLRIQIADGLYHVTSKGNRRSAIFLDGRDRSRFLDIFGAVCAKRGWRCHAFCLMTTHYHLLVSTPHPDIGAGMQYLNGVYAQSFNRKHREEGHVFKGRYFSLLVERESHFLEVVRYIALNPARAGVLSHPEDWPWSSYAAMMGVAPRPSFLDLDRVLTQFSPDLVRARTRLRSFVNAARPGVDLAA